MRVYTAINSDNQPAFSVNATCIEEAKHVIGALIGDSDMTIRRATPTECDLNRRPHWRP
jgi:hypothetical protein